MSQSISSKMCESKIGYSNMIVAFCAAGRLSVIHGNEQRPYQCPLCRKWHLTTKPKREDAVKAEAEAAQLFVKA